MARASTVDALAISLLLLKTAGTLLHLVAGPPKHDALATPLPKEQVQ